MTHPDKTMWRSAKAAMIGAALLANPNLASAQATLNEQGPAGDLVITPYIDLAVGTRTADPIRLSSTPVRVGETFLTVPLAYRRGAVLTADLLATNGQVLLPAGSRGYWAGRLDGDYNRLNDGFSPAGNALQIHDTDVWCFWDTTTPAGKSLCLRQTDNSVLWFEPTTNPYFLTGSIPALAANRVRQFQWQAAPVSLTADDHLAYRIVSWRNGRVRVQVFAGGREVEVLEGTRKPDGSAEVKTVAGILVIRTTARNDGPFTVTLRQPAKPASRSHLLEVGLDQQQRLALARTLELDALRTGRIADVVEGFSEHPYRIDAAALVNSGTVRMVPGQVLGTQRIHPVRAWRLPQGVSPPAASRNTPLFPADAVFFEDSKIGSKGTLMCWREGLSTATQTQRLTQRGVCLEDGDQDGAYEVVWREPRFAPNSRFIVDQRGDRNTRLGSAQNPPVRFEPADPAVLGWQDLEITYRGALNYRVMPGGVLTMSSVSFGFRLTGSGEEPEAGSLIRGFTVQLDRNGQGQYTSGDGTAFIRVEQSAPDGSITARFESPLVPGVGAIGGRAELARFLRQDAARGHERARRLRAGESIDLIGQ